MIACYIHSIKTYLESYITSILEIFQKTLIFFYEIISITGYKFNSIHGRFRMSDRDSKQNTNNDFLNDIPVDVVIELGRKTLLIREVKELKENEVVTLDQTVNDPLDIRVGDKLIAEENLSW